MDAVFKKLNYKGQKDVIILNGPESFDGNIDSIRDAATIHKSPEGISDIQFIMIFVTKQTEIDTIIPLIAPRLVGDAVLWMVYPKGTSKRYKCDFNRDTGWAIMGKYDIEPVRMVAIDDDWSALRFKKVEFIKTMTRNSAHALSDSGRAKSEKGKKS